MPLKRSAALRSADIQGSFDDASFSFPYPKNGFLFSPRINSSYTSDDSESDYIYLTENMASFKGNNIHAIAIT